MKFKPYPKYKASGVEWLGQVPIEWQVSRLKRVAESFPSNVDKKSVEGEEPVFLCNYTDVYYNEQITSGMEFMRATATTAQIDRFTLREGDVIITKDSETADDIGRSTYVPQNLPGIVCGYHLSMIRVGSEANGRYIKKLFDSHFLRASLEVSAQGLTRVGLGQYQIDNLILPLPPIEDQEQIALLLDRETTKLDTLIAKQEKLIELLQEKRQAMISHAVTKGLDPSVPMKDSGIKWLGEVPEHWQVAPFKRAVGFQEGPGILADDFRDEGVPLLRVANVGGRYTVMDGCNFLDPEKVAKKWKHFCVRTGDLLISASASMGTVTEVTEEANGAVPYTGLIRLFPDEEWACKSFVAYFVVSDAFLRQIDRFKTGATIQHFGPTHLSQMYLSLPPIPEQIAIAKRLDRMLAKIDALIDRSRHNIDLMRERRTTLISAAVTGKIDVRGEKSNAAH